MGEVDALPLQLVILQPVPADRQNLGRCLLDSDDIRKSVVSVSIIELVVAMHLKQLKTGVGLDCGLDTAQTILGLLGLGVGRGGVGQVQVGVEAGDHQLVQLVSTAPHDMGVAFG